MNSEKQIPDATTKVNSAISRLKDSRLVDFDEDSRVTPGKDINNKITTLDADLAQLRMELSSINNSVEEGLDRLSDTDTDLTAKVSETYKRLGEIDNAYKSLLQISSRIDSDIMKLNGDINEVAEQSATGIKSLEETTVSQSNALAQKNHQVVSKVNQLVETSKLTSEMMHQSIQSVTDKMLLIEKNVLAQIENLASLTNDKTASIESRLEQNKAKILKLQTVDEAIIRRATTLEITAAELSAKVQYLDSSVEQLQISSDTFSTSINALKQRTRALEDRTENHAADIDGLKKEGADMVAELAAVSDRQHKQFSLSMYGFLVLAVASLAIYFGLQNSFDHNAAFNAQQIAELQQVQSASDAAANESLVQLEARLDSKLETKLSTKLQQVDQQLVEMQDQAHSVAGRLNQESPFSQIGDDNVIHGPRWIAGLSPDNYTVQLAHVDSREMLYQIAKRYNYYLKDSLSYFILNDNGAVKYVLLSGSYATRQQAMSAVESMPGYIEMQRPAIRKISTVQQYIAAI